MWLYAVARRGKGTEYYVPLERGYVIGWTADRDKAWAWERRSYAERVREEIEGHGVYGTFIHVFWEGI